MADIYAASLSTISASLATSGESTLFESRQLYDLIQIPTAKDQKTTARLYITDQVLHYSADDVVQGNLGSRGWCFQERLLTTRLLHFGRDQFHWECHEGIWSESNVDKQWYDDLTTHDDCEFREKLVSEVLLPEVGTRLEGLLAENATKEANSYWEKFLSDLGSLELAEDKIAAQKEDDERRRPQYDAWYSAVSAYTSRGLTNQGDELPALAGAAVRFGSFIKDTYAAGLWVADMAHGLLWSRKAFEDVEVDADMAFRPGVGGRGDQQRTAPSWSWASVEGAVHWVRHRGGPVLLGPYAFMTAPKDENVYGEPAWAALWVKGRLLEVELLSLLRDEAQQPESYTDFEEQLAALPARYQPRMDFDDPGLEEMLLERGGTRPLYFLLIASFPSGPEDSDDQLSELGYALMLRYFPSDEACRRVGIAQVAVRDFAEANVVDIGIF